MLAWLWGVLLVGATVFVSIAGTLLVRRWVPVEVLERHNEVAGFIYAVIGVVYAVLLGFTAIIVWERYDKAQAALDAETNDLIDLYRDAETFRMTFAKSWKLSSVHTPGLWLRKNGQPWPNTSPVPKSGMLIPSCGEPTTGSNPRTRTKEFGTQRQSQDLTISAISADCAS